MCESMCHQGRGAAARTGAGQAHHCAAATGKQSPHLCHDGLFHLCVQEEGAVWPAVVGSVGSAVVVARNASTTVSGTLHCSICAP